MAYIPYRDIGSILVNGLDVLFVRFSKVGEVLTADGGVGSRLACPAPRGFFLCFFEEAWRFGNWHGRKHCKV